MIRPVTSTSDIPISRPPLAFVLAEIILMISVPVVGWLGFDSLLDSRAGEFVTQPGPDDPGWVVFVEPSPVTVIVETLDDVVTGVALVAQPDEQRAGGAVVLLPGELSIDGAALSSMRATDVAAALGDHLNLSIPNVEVINDARWSQVLGNSTWLIENPDPVPAADGSIVLPVGTVHVGADQAGAFVGRPAVGATAESLVIRRQLLWEALIAAPPESETTLAGLLGALGRGVSRIQLAPTQPTPSGPEIAREEMEALLAQIVPFPAGAEPGGRLRLRVLARSPEIDLAAVAAELGAAGHEIVQIGNAVAFDDGPNEILIPLGVADDRIDGLAAALGSASVLTVDDDAAADLVTVLIGSSD